MNLVSDNDEVDDHVTSVDAEEFKEALEKKASSDDGGGAGAGAAGSLQHPYLLRKASAKSNRSVATASSVETVVTVIRPASDAAIMGRKDAGFLTSSEVHYERGLSPYSSVPGSVGASRRSSASGPAGAIQLRRRCASHDALLAASAALAKDNGDNGRRSPSPSSRRWGEGGGGRGTLLLIIFYRPIYNGFFYLRSSLYRSNASLGSLVDTNNWSPREDGAGGTGGRLRRRSRMGSTVTLVIQPRQDDEDDDGGGGGQMEWEEEPTTGGFTRLVRSKSTLSLARGASAVGVAGIDRGGGENSSPSFFSATGQPVRSRSVILAQSGRRFDVQTMQEALLHLPSLPQSNAGSGIIYDDDGDGDAADTSTNSASSVSVSQVIKAPELMPVGLTRAATAPSAVAPLQPQAQPSRLPQPCSADAQERTRSVSLNSLPPPPSPLRLTASPLWKRRKASASSRPSSTTSSFTNAEVAAAAAPSPPVSSQLLLPPPPPDPSPPNFSLELSPCPDEAARSRKTSASSLVLEREEDAVAEVEVEFDADKVDDVDEKDTEGDEEIWRAEADERGEEGQVVDDVERQGDVETEQERVGNATALEDSSSLVDRRMEARLPGVSTSQVSEESKEESLSGSHLDYNFPFRIHLSESPSSSVATPFKGLLKEKASRKSSTERYLRRLRGEEEMALEAENVHNMPPAAPPSRPPLLRKISTNTSNYLRWLREVEEEEEAAAAEMANLQPSSPPPPPPPPKMPLSREASDNSSCRGMPLSKTHLTRESSNTSFYPRNLRGEEGEDSSRNSSQESAAGVVAPAGSSWHDRESQEELPEQVKKTPLSRQESEVSFLRSILRARNLESDDDDEAKSVSSSLATDLAARERGSLSRDSSTKSSGMTRSQVGGSAATEATGSYLSFLSRRRLQQQQQQRISETHGGRRNRDNSIQEEEEEEGDNDGILEEVVNSDALNRVEILEEEEEEGEEENAIGEKEKEKRMEEKGDKDEVSDSNYESASPYGGSARSSAADVDASNVRKEEQEEEEEKEEEEEEDMDRLDDGNAPSSPPQGGDQPLDRRPTIVVLVPDQDEEENWEDNDNNDEGDDDDDGEFLGPEVTHKKDSGYGSQGQLMVGKVGAVNSIFDLLIFELIKS